MQGKYFFFRQAVFGLVLMAAGLLPAAVSGADAAADDTVVYRDGDLLRGRLDTLAPEGGALQWVSGRPDAVAAFSLDGLHAVHLAPRPAPAGIREHGTLVTLTNGDRIPGDLLALDAKTVRLDTWYAGTLVLKRAMVRSVEMQSVSGVLYDGPKDAAEWTAFKADAGTKPWSLEGGALVVRKDQHQAVFHEMPGMPSTVRIEVEAQWTPYLETGVVLCAGDKADTGLRWQVEPQEGAAILTVWAGKKRKQSVQIQAPSGAAVRLVFFLDRKAGTCAVEAGGARVAEITGIPPASLAGNRVVLQSSTRGDSDDPAWFRVKFTSIRVSGWDGRLGESGVAAPAAPEEDRVRLASGDAVSGRITGLAKGKLVLETSYARMKFPLAAVAAVEFSGKKAEQARLRAGDFRAEFANGGGSMTLALTELRRGVLKGTSENFGTASLPLAALARLEFSLYADAASATPAPAASATPATDRLVFAGGDRLCGNLLSLSGGVGTLAWRHAAKSGGTVAFDAAALYEAALKPRPADGVRTHADAVVLDTGASLAGDLVSADEKSVVLDTWYAGRLTLDRSRVRLAAPGDVGKTLYAGPVSGEEWEVWSYWGGGSDKKIKTADGVLTLTAEQGGGVVRSVENLPPAVRLDFEADWGAPGPRAGLNLGLFAKGENGAPSGLRLQLETQGGNVRWVSKRANGGFIFKNFTLPSLGSLLKDCPRVRVTVLVDRKSRRGAVLFNGEQVCALQGDEAGVDDGPDQFYFGCYPNGNRRPPVIRNIRVSSWNGRMPASSGRAAGGGDDVVTLSEGDAVSGKVAGVADGKLRVRAAFGDMAIPLAKVVQVEFGGASTVAAKPAAGGVKVWMLTGGTFVLGDARVDGDVLRGTLDGVGAVVLRLSASARLEFNLETPRKIQVPEKFLYKPPEAKPAEGVRFPGGMMRQGGAIMINNAPMLE